MPRPHPVPPSIPIFETAGYLKGAIHNIGDSCNSAWDTELLQRAKNIAAGAQPFVTTGGAVREEKRLDMLRPKRIPPLAFLDLHRRQIESLRVEPEMHPQRMKCTQCLHTLIQVANKHLHARPKTEDKGVSQMNML